MISRTTDTSLNLQQLQKLVVDAERIGFRLVSLVAAEYMGMRFNHLSLDDAPILPNDGPYSVLVPLAAGAGAPGSNPVVANHLANGKKLLFAAPVYVSGNAVNMAVLR